jgi:hypothetical protein
MAGGLAVLADQLAGHECLHVAVHALDQTLATRRQIEGDRSVSQMVVGQP